ncbi:GTPase Era [Candidatus Viadribacter manganicus]|uniref:GTPase Era n=1 Tax=Candidatus Viadribacter manganicus TaxID=1759059 RepID=A0A1B1ADK3_9PROT|nr:GTPase Era [Candidatus Viadribacter manganicus]ANP44640.1 GTPase Era [Candidatus Viadribacter manganicus]
MTEQRCAVVAVLGAPNAGKSTLVNTLVGSKVAAVTQKVQTTRALVRGIAMRDEVQLVLIDTPGVFAPKRRLDRAMVAAAWSALEGADAIVHVVDAAAHASGEKGADAHAVSDTASIAAKLKQMELASILVLNKVDAVARPQLLEITTKLVEAGLYTDVFMIAARKGDGVDDIARTLAERAPEGPWLFPEDQTMDAPERVLAAEITREKAFLRLHEELPYELMVETETWEERKDGSAKIEQTIFVSRESQRKIAIGAKGATIKTIGELARKEMEEAFGRRIHLFLHVKVDENWTEQRALYKRLGLDFEA